jgi:thiol-disulfide isomerase/thioredoxin
MRDSVNGANHGLLVLAKALPGASDTLVWNECRKRSQQRQLTVYCRRRESKMEIPAKIVLTVSRKACSCLKSIALLLTLTAGPLAAQSYLVPLHIKTDILQDGFLTYAMETDDANHLHVDLPGGLTIHAERLPAPYAGITAHIPGATPEAVTLLDGQESIISLKRQVANLGEVPYVIGYSRSEDHGKLNESISWRSDYLAEGTLRMPGCKVNIAVWDFNGDGIFDRKDAQATTIEMDLNDDGSFGRGEYTFMSAIVHVCGRDIQVAELDPSGNSITFEIAPNHPIKVGTPVPHFSVSRTDGQLLRSADMRGEVTVLDFWASWCAICVAKMGEVETLAQEHAADARFYGINVDGPEAISRAKRIVVDKRISYPQVMRGLGTEDPLWRQFGSVGTNDLSTPLYVVVDRVGTITYAGSGGLDLAELKKAVNDAIATPSSGLKGREHP